VTAFYICARCTRILESFHPWRFRIVDGQHVCIDCLGDEESCCEKAVRAYAEELAWEYLEKNNGLQTENKKAA
jgi:hypothetical protein